MAYDEDLADRIRGCIDLGHPVAEKRMFGGLAFLVRGNMAVAASGRGGLLVRVDPAEGDALTGRDGVEPMVMRGRPMSGWLVVSDTVTADDAALAEWVRRGVAYAAGLPAK